MPLSWTTDIIWLNYPTNRCGLGVVFHMHRRAVVALLRPYRYACGERLCPNLVISPRHKLLVAYLLFASALLSAFAYLYLPLFATYFCLPLATSTCLCLFLLACLCLLLFDSVFLCLFTFLFAFTYLYLFVFV